MDLFHSFVTFFGKASLTTAMQKKITFGASQNPLSPCALARQVEAQDGWVCVARGYFPLSSPHICSPLTFYACKLPLLLLVT